MYFDRFIEPNLEDYTPGQFEVLLDGANKNNQVYWRNRGKSDCLAILKAAKNKLPDDYEYRIYTYLPVDKMNEIVEEDQGEV